MLINRTFQGGIGLLTLALAVAGACGEDDGGAGVVGAGGSGGGSSSVTTGPSVGTGSTSVSASSGAGPAACNDAPWNCPAGQTCAITDGGTFNCLPSGQGTSGDECRSLIDAPECGDGLLCVQLSENTPGVCSPFCDLEDPAHGCPSGVECVGLRLQSGSEISACDVGDLAGTGGGGGAGGGGGGGGAGGG